MEEQQEHQANLMKLEHTHDLVTHYWFSINQVTGLIKASELKAGFILSFYGIVLNFVYKGATTLLTTVANDTLLWIFIGLWSLSTAASIFFSMRCFIPKIEKKYDKNVFFFGDVISKFGTVKEFSETFYTISKNEDLLFRQLGEQIFILSKIAVWKFRNVQKALLFLALGLCFLFITAVYYSVIGFV